MEKNDQKENQINPKKNRQIKDSKKKHLTEGQKTMATLRGLAFEMSPGSSALAENQKLMASLKGPMFGMSPVSSALAENQKLMASLRGPMYGMSSVSSALAENQKLMASLRGPALEMSPVKSAFAENQKLMASLRGPALEMSPVRSAYAENQKTMASLRALVEMYPAKAALAGLTVNNPMLKVNNNLNWVLTNPVLKQMSIRNPNLEKQDYAKIFRKIPKEKYKLNPHYNSEKDNFGYVLENQETKDTIPVEELPNAIAVMDVIESLTAEEVFEFYNYLVKFPMLGLYHRVGKKIFNGIKKLSLTKFNDLTLYRVRDRHIKQRPLPFTELEMYNPPHGIASNGRFNVFGQGELYTCSSEAVAFKEVEIKEDKEYKYDIIKWKLVKPVELLDLSCYDSPIVAYSSFEKSTNNNQEYLIPNFLSQCVKFHEISGIKYKSIVDSNASNYVFFDFEKKWFKTIRLKVDLKGIGV